ncbi:MAG: hypothetical protein E7335_07370 [Clostridiales bacterium]|nr:hypothetical protein [Clostridiales bacterium]
MAIFSRVSNLHADRATEEASPEKRMRTLAMQLQTDSSARLSAARGSVRAIRKIGEMAGRLTEACRSITPAMEWINDNIRIIETYCEQMQNERGSALPACGGHARIAIAAEAIIANGNAQLEAENVTNAVAAFDDVASLTMEEIWKIPAALRIEICRALIGVSRRILQEEKQRLKAQKWVDAGADTAKLAGKKHSDAFFARALQLVSEMEMPEARSALEEHILNRDTDAQSVVRIANERQAIECMRMSNLLSGMRLLDKLDWEAEYTVLSRAERELLRDPSGTYPHMDKASQQAVRARVQMLSKRLELGEATIVRNAVNAACKHEGVRKCVCWWLYDDNGTEQLKEKLRMSDIYTPPVIQDPKGEGYIGAILICALVIWLIFAWSTGNMLLAFIGIPAAWHIASGIIGAIFTRVIRPRPLLKMEIKKIPREAATLVTIPALLSSVSRAKELTEQLEILGCLETDENLAFLLLGDFGDAKEEHMPGDEEILETVRNEIARMNEKAGREKYFYLHRSRTLSTPDGIWMGQERKRGALMDLYRLLLGGESTFLAEETCALQLQKRYRYVLTLDADTRMLPGTAHRLLGTILHPLNQSRVENGERHGYALIQPRMEHSLESGRNEFVRLMAGRGGADSYPVSVSDVYQDLTGQGIFGGKGIVDVEAFFAGVSGKFPDNAVLSHDMIEGIYAGAGYASDIVLYDSFPSTPGGYLRRQERWIRGDWQLMRFIARRDISDLDRYKLIDNLRRSMTEPVALALIVLGLWLANSAAILLGLLVPLLPAVLFPGNAQWKRAVAELGFLPMKAGTQFSAAARAVYRSFFSHRKMLEWVPSAEAEGNADTLAAWIAAILMLPAVVHLRWTLFALALAVLFLIMPGYLKQLSMPEKKKGLDEEEKRFLKELAADTWRFFERFTEEGLPPDNVQIDPPAGCAARTSPTNIGLYFVSCLCAQINGLIGEEEMLSRMGKTMDALEKMPKWKGHLYNWHDIHTLEALSPKYVSSVDSGNLAACLLLCAEAVGGECGLRMREFCNAMDLHALYDEKRALFVIGVDTEHERFSASHYDLLASESRILSYVAIMTEQAPVKHFGRLGRGTTGGRENALISWSGTMFEYLMPELFIRAGEGSLIGESIRHVIRGQIRQGERNARPWGVSESGYYEFDRELNYQYRAFGMREFALSGNSQGEVIAPYASALALAYAPHAACRNLRRMSELGWRGEFGMYEAVDFDIRRVPKENDYAMVYSHMAHHQGMLLAAVTNALHDDVLPGIFMRQSEAKAILLLLEEKPAERTRTGRKHEAETQRNSRGTYIPRRVDGKTWPDMHMLSGAGGLAVVGIYGEGFYRKNGILANRWSGNCLRKNEGMYVHIEETGSMKAFLASGQKDKPEWLVQNVSYEAGNAAWTSKAGSFECRLEMCISPEDGTLVERMTVENTSASSIQIRTTSAFAVALMNEAELSAHPAFYGLFVQSSYAGNGALRFVRRKRSPDEKFPQLLHAVASDVPIKISCETDLAKLAGREGELGHAGGMTHALTGTVGSVLNPCSALRAEFALKAGQKAHICFYVNLCDEEKCDEWLENSKSIRMAYRAGQLAGTQAVTALRYMGIGDAMHRLFQRSSALFANTGLTKKRGQLGSMPINGLWSLGISGDLPIVAVHIAAKAEMENAREALRMHEFYHEMGLWIDLLLINEYGNDYEQPVRDALSEMINSCRLRDWAGKNGGIHLIEGNTLSESTRQLISAAAVIEADGNGSISRRIQERLSELKVPEESMGIPAPFDGFVLPEIEREAFNGYGGFVTEGYCMDVLPCKATPAPWVNILANPHFGTLVSERGGGFTWYKNSRNGRITPFDNDTLREGWGEMLYVIEGNTYFLAMPGPKTNRAYRVLHSQGYSRFLTGTDEIRSNLTVFVDKELPVKWMLLELENAGEEKNLTVRFAIDWLMGVSNKDTRLLHAENMDGALFATGSMEGCAFATILNADVNAGGNLRAFLGEGTICSPRGILGESEGGSVLTAHVGIGKGEKATLACAVGCAEDFLSAKHLLEKVRSMQVEERLEAAKEWWNTRLDALQIKTPDTLLNAMLNRYLPYQALAGRIWGRAGLYQAGGAHGFRDQLQDMLLAMLYEPQTAREHILFCAAHQFEDGDVMHWWHPNRAGVRTKITDDLLFLPFVTTKYVEYTGDRGILNMRIPYLKNEKIPEEREDWYGEAQVSEVEESLFEHCMRAIRRSVRKGSHGLILMGTGDWNDGMNRIGAEGRGESVWLTQFLSVVAREFGHLTGQKELINLSEELNRAIENAAWDGKWYRRAYDDAGRPVGGGERIDAISQSWAVFAGLDKVRTKQAMESVKERLINSEDGIVRLLAPPFDGECESIGYIAGYVPGVRENGGQYTHAACWTGIALAELNRIEDAWNVLQMLMPYSHSDSPEKAEKYKVEPYAVAADIYAEEPHTGRGGWTWYTGAAGWMVRFAVFYLLGYERNGNRASIHALLPEGWKEVRVTVRVGNAHYELVSRRGAADREPVELIDDGRNHIALFPAKNE